MTEDQERILRLARNIVKRAMIKRYLLELRREPQK